MLASLLFLFLMLGVSDSSFLKLRTCKLDIAAVPLGKMEFEANCFHPASSIALTITLFEDKSDINKFFLLLREPKTGKVVFEFCRELQEFDTHVVDEPARLVKFTLPDAFLSWSMRRPHGSVLPMGEFHAEAYIVDGNSKKMIARSGILTIKACP